MRKITQFIALTFIALSLTSAAQEDVSLLNDGYISDELFIYMHSGAGNNYRIVGSIEAGAQIKFTGEEINGYTEVIDDKNRRAWVEDKFVSAKPGLRFVVAELNGQLATNGERETSLQRQVSELENKLSNSESSSLELRNQVIALESQLATTQSKLSNQDIDTKKDWFFNGAIVLSIGLLFGLVLPRLANRKKSSMENWK